MSEKKYSEEEVKKIVERALRQTEEEPVIKKEDDEKMISDSTLPNRWQRNEDDSDLLKTFMGKSFIESRISFGLLIIIILLVIIVLLLL